MAEEIKQEKVSTEVSWLLQKFEWLMEEFKPVKDIPTDKWAEVEVIHERLIKLDMIFGTLAKLARFAKASGTVLDQLAKDFPNADELLILVNKCSKYIYGIESVDKPNGN